MTNIGKDCVIACPTCGERFNEDEWQDLDFISGGPLSKAENDASIIVGKSVFRRCEYCNGQICRETLFDGPFSRAAAQPPVDALLDDEPVTERNPVPSIPPRPAAAVTDPEWLALNSDWPNDAEGG